MRVKRSVKSNESCRRSRKVVKRALHDTLSVRSGSLGSPVEISVLAIGYKKDGAITHLPPPTPPLSLDNIFLCSMNEVANFTPANKLDYLRQILKHPEAPAAELLAAHFIQANAAHLESGSTDWILDASRELTVLLKDDFAMLTDVFGAVAAAIPEIEGGE